MAEVVLDKVNKLYDNGFHAVQDLDLNIADGEFLVLVGPSGCGKSTALRMIAGLEDISTGTLRIGDRVVNTLSPKDRDIAMVFQSYALYPHMTVADNIAYGLNIRKMDKDEIKRRVAKAADMLELGPLLDRKPKQLSGGQRQRVAMGRAIVREPQVFLMDEPLSNLDAKLRVQMRAEIAQVQHDLDVTTIYVTHDQIEAMTMGDRVAVMKAGVLQQVGSPQLLYDHPDTLFVAGFIGSPPMNMGIARVEQQGDSYTLRLGSTRLPVSDAMLAERPALASYAGRDVAVGIRSEDMDDASVFRGEPGATGSRRRSPSPRRSARRSWSTSPSTPRRSSPRTPRLLEKDAGTTDMPEHAMAGTKFVASFTPRSRVRPGAEIEVAVDTDRLHVFDPATGGNPHLRPVRPRLGRRSGRPNRAARSRSEHAAASDTPHHDGSPLYAGTDRPDLGDIVPVWLRVPRATTARRRVGAQHARRRAALRRGGDRPGGRARGLVSRRRRRSTTR